MLVAGLMILFSASLDAMERLDEDVEMTEPMDIDRATRNVWVFTFGPGGELKSIVVEEDMTSHWLRGVWNPIHLNWAVWQTSV